MTSEGWTWEFRPRADDAFEKLEAEDQDQIVAKLENVVTNQWRDPPEWVEPLTGAHHGKIRVGQLRLGATADRESETLIIYTIDPRSNAYKGDD